VVLGSRAVSHASLSRYESGKQEIPLRIVEALGQLYGVPAGVLLMMPPPEKIAAKPA
jgi:transcriptional regulator with XRE-family HTH domain